ncbi:hypothetical protein Tco_0806014 [Tanacetum coccineum]
MDFSLSISTKTCFDRCAKLVDAILLRASAFLFLLLGTRLMEKLVKPLIRLLVFSRYLTIFSSLATYVPRIWFATSLETTLTCTLRTPICAAIQRPAISASYSASLLEEVNFVPSRLVSIKPAPDPSTHDDPSVNSVYGSCGGSTTDVSGGFSSGFSTRKSARICPFTDVLGRYTISSSFSLGATSKGSSDRDLFAELERNLFKLANFPLRLWTSLIVRGDGSCNTASVLSGHDFIPSGLILYPRNIPSTAPKVHFWG